MTPTDNHSLAPLPADDPPKPIRKSFVHNLLVALMNVVKILIGSYGLSASLHLMLRVMIGERSTLISFFNTFAHLLWMPALILLPLLLVFRQWRIALMLVLPALAFIGTYGGQFLPKSVQIPVNVKRFTIYTHNVLANNRTPASPLDGIRDADADIVTLQEVSPEFAEMLEELDYPYMAIHPGEGRDTMGQAIVSRYPILEDDYWHYDWLKLPLAHQRAVLDIEGQQVVVYNVHPTHPGMSDGFYNPRARRREIEDVLSRIAQETLPVVMIGDFNMSDLNEEYGIITATLTDTFRETANGMGFTFPDLSSASVQESTRIAPDFLPEHPPIPPLLRLDYAFHSKGILGVQAIVWQSAHGSDHRPLFVELALDS